MLLHLLLLLSQTAKREARRVERHAAKRAASMAPVLAGPQRPTAEQLALTAIPVSHLSVGRVTLIACALSLLFINIIFCMIVIIFCSVI